MCDDVMIPAGPLPHSLFCHAVAVSAGSLHSAYCCGDTSQPPEIQKNLLGRDPVEMKLLQLTEAVSETAHCFGPGIPLQMAAAAEALGGEFSVLLLVHPDSVSQRKSQRSITLHNSGL